MITNLLPYIYGIGNLALGVFLFLVAFKIYNLKFKDEERKVKIESILNKYSILIRLFSIYLILNGSYDLIVRDTNRYRIVNENNKWTEEDREGMIKACLIGADENTKKYHKFMQEYSESTTDKIMKAMTRVHYMELSKKPKEEQLKEYMPLINEDLKLLRHRIDSVENLNKQQ